jgi:phosphoribosylglycinamide formyltransferase-1
VDALARLTELCLALPEAERELSGRHAGFRVRGRTFAYYLDDHQGDGIVGLVCKAPPGASEALVAAAPERFYRLAYLHHRGWIGLRLDRGPVDWDEAAGLATDSYVLVAPKRLAALVVGGP